MNWQPGRQGMRYHKLKLFESKLFKFDIYLLKFEPYAHIHSHKDMVDEGYEHHRLNIALRTNKSSFFWTKEPGGHNRYWHDERIMYFKPSEIEHGMMGNYDAKCEKTAYWLSFGWLWKKQ